MAIDADRDALHALVDALPQERLAAARAALAQLSIPDDDEPLTDEERALMDPVLLALLTAPLEDEELSADELAALEQAEAERDSGALAHISDAELARRLGERAGTSSGIREPRKRC